MNYEEKQRLIALRDNMKSYGYMDGVEELESIFPELAESEDERMCTRCIELLRKVSAYSGEEYLGVEIVDCIIGLQALRKKLKESLYIPETCKENADSFTDEDGIRQMLIDHFTRYKIGNVSTKLNGFLIDDIIAFVKNQKIPNARQRLAELSKTEEGKAKYEAVAKEMREEMEKEQKPADRFEEAREKYQVEWSEEDENALKYLHELISFGYTEKFFDAQTAADMREWLNTRLKFLRPRWKPSEVCYGVKGDPDPAGVWKPSEEQMGALYDSIEWEEERAEDVDFILKSLYNDLKKLM